MEDAGHRGRVSKKGRRAKEGCPSRYDRQDPDVHGVSDITVRAPYHQPGWRVDWRRRAAAGSREVPETPEVNGGAGDERRRGENQAPGTKGRQRNVPRSNRIWQIGGHRAGHENRERQVLYE